MAIDISIDAEDGLGAARRLAEGLDRPFPVVRAEFDHLPLADGAADVVIYNASLHYSTDVAVTLAEALRVLAPGGELVILDSPIYRSAASGGRMVAERKAAYLQRYGFASDALGSREYLIDADRTELGARFGLAWQRLVPWYGWRWAWRPWRARLRREREPARFEVWVGRRSRRAIIDADRAEPR
jgi:SAM-dependent methyltransferase